MNRKNIESQNFYYRDGEPVKDAELLSTLEVFQFDEYSMHVVTEKNHSLTQVFTDADHNGFFQMSGVKILDPNVLDTHTTLTKYGQNTHWVEIEGKKVEVFEFKIKEIRSENNVTQQQPIEPLAKRARIEEESQPAIRSDEIVQMIKNAGLEYMLGLPEPETIQETTLAYNNSTFDDAALDRLIAATDVSYEEVAEEQPVFNVDNFFATRIGNSEFNDFLSRVNDEVKDYTNKEYIRVNITIELDKYLKKVIDEEANIRNHIILKSSKESRRYVEIKVTTAKRLKHLYSNEILRDKSTLVSDAIANKALLFAQHRSSPNNLRKPDILRKSDAQNNLRKT